MRWLNPDPIVEEGGENLYLFCRNNGISQYDILGLKCTVGTFNILSISITSTPQWIMTDLNALERDAEALLNALNKAGYVSAGTSLASSAGLSALLLNVSDIATSNSMSPNINSLSRSIMALINKLRNQGPMRLDGVLKWVRCECVSGKTEWVRQADITDSDEVPMENVGIPTAYSNDFRSGYKKVEKELIKKMMDELKRRK